MFDGMYVRSNLPASIWYLIARDVLTDRTDSEEPMNRKRQSAGRTPMKCRISGASMGRGRFSTNNATFDSLNSDVGYDTLTDGNGIVGSDFWTVAMVICGGRAL